MIIVKAPLRVSIAGGGTDLPSFYTKNGSFFISAAINKYVYISINKSFESGIILKYSKGEKVTKAQEIEHPIFREALLKFPNLGNIEIGSFSDIPSGTGLGSSSSFTVALLKALHTYTNTLHDNMTLATQACEIELNDCCNPIGVQDQYISAIGGLTSFKIDSNTVHITATPTQVLEGFKTEFEDSLMLFFTGYSRNANQFLEIQQIATLYEDQKMLSNLKRVQELAYEAEIAFLQGNLEGLALIFNEQWNLKKSRCLDSLTMNIDDYHKHGLNNGALGGKLVGAGGGGFLMFITQDRKRLKKAMSELGLQYVPIQFDSLGVRVVLND